jgi:hypothetical protein
VIAYGWWDDLFLGAYRVAARCGSSCDHLAMRILSPEELRLANMDLFALVADDFEAAFDRRHDSVPVAR